jgi:hypothetical protein
LPCGALQGPHSNYDYQLIKLIEPDELACCP